MSDRERKLAVTVGACAARCKSGNFPRLRRLYIVSQTEQRRNFRRERRTESPFFPMDSLLEVEP